MVDCSVWRRQTDVHTPIPFTHHAQVIGQKCARNGMKRASGSSPDSPVVTTQHVPQSLLPVCSRTFGYKRRPDSPRELNKRNSLRDSRLGLAARISVCLPACPPKWEKLPAKDASTTVDLVGGHLLAVREAWQRMMRSMRVGSVAIRLQHEVAVNRRRVLRANCTAPSTLVDSTATISCFRLVSSADIGSRQCLQWTSRMRWTSPIKIIRSNSIHEASQTI